VCIAKIDRVMNEKNIRRNENDLSYSAKTRFENDSERTKTVMSPWPPWRLPNDCDPGFEDPRRVLHSRKLARLYNENQMHLELE